MMDQQQHHINSNDIEFGEMQIPGSIPTVQLQPPRLQIYHKGINTSHENTDVKNNSNGPGAENGSLHKTVRYRECLKNHAASIGSHAVDGCGEFMAGEEEEEAMKCQACGCHRNFHRREAEGEWSYGVLRWPRSGGHVPEGGHVPVPEDGHVRGHVLVMPEDGHLPGYGRRVSAAKKRFRTKFTGEQKEKMLGFAQRLGWRIQKQDEGAVQQFCNEVGVRRHVLKVWMHNNKHIMVKKE